MKATSAASRNRESRTPSSIENWPFDDPPNVAVVTTREITQENAPILLVSHDEEDGGWQFLPGGGPLLEENARVVALRRIWLLDPSVGQLADLSLGWQASRRSPLEPWRRATRSG